MRKTPSDIFVEMYPLREDNLPDLHAYSLDLGGGESFTIGGKLSYQLGKKLTGHWVYADHRIFTDLEPEQHEVDKVIEGLWTLQSDIYRNVRGLKRDYQWKPSPYAKGMYVRRVIDIEHGSGIRRLLRDKKVELGSCSIERIHDIRNWVVQGAPALSISVRSRLIHQDDLFEYSKTIDMKKLVGLWVEDKNTSFKGAINDIVGRLGDHRNRLLRLTSTERTIEILENSVDDVPVVSVGRQQYEYAATCLVPIIRPENYAQFRLNPKQINKNVTISPRERYELVYRISRVIGGEGWIDYEYSTKNNPDLFLTPQEIGFSPFVMIGNDSIVEHGKNLFYDLKKKGLYKYSEGFNSGKPIRMGVIRSDSVGTLDNFFETLERELSSIGFDLEKVADIQASSSTRRDLELCINTLEKEDPDIILGVFQQSFEYDTFKSLTLGRGLVSQIVLARTLDNRYAMPNIILGIIGKTGNTPFILSEPLTYADIIVGIDVAREKKKRLSGTINVAALARIFFSNGQFVRYVIHDEPIEGETIPVNVLQSMFPVEEFEGRRVIVHRDGQFRGEEVKTLREWGEAIDATIHPVEVLKSGAPRVYGADSISPSPKGVGWPQVGSIMKMDQKSALVVTTLPVSKDSTPQPLRITSKSDLSIEEAVHSVLSLTLLHYGSTRRPRLPVTVHYSDDIAGLALRGIKPKELTGSRLYWL